MNSDFTIDGNIVPDFFCEALPGLTVAWNYSCGKIECRNDKIFVDGLELVHPVGSRNVLEVMLHRGVGNGALLSAVLKNPKATPIEAYFGKVGEKTLPAEMFFPGTFFYFEFIPSIKVSVSGQKKNIPLPLPGSRIEPLGRIQPGRLIIPSIRYKHGALNWRLHYADFFFASLIYQLKPEKEPSAV